MKPKARTFLFAAILALAAVPVFLGGDPSPSIVLADDPTPADPFCPENVPPPCSR